MSKDNFLSKFLLLLNAFVLAGLISCDSETVAVKPSYTGRSGELLIICQNDLWQGDLGDSIVKYLQPNFPMLPQAEGIFNLVHFEGDQINQLLSRHRNILTIDIDPNKEEGISSSPSKEAKGQVYLTLHAKTKTAALSLVKQSAPNIIAQIRKEERKRYQSWLALHREASIEQQIVDSFGYSIIVPFGAKLLELESDFVRLSWEREKILGGKQHFMQIGMVLYKSPYSSDSIYTAEGLSDLRNRELKRIPGPKEGSVMSIQSFIQPEAIAVTPNNSFSYAMELRGLWRTTESFLGGPFVSLSQLNKEGTEIITTEAFVLAPKFDKREFMKESEAIVHSLYRANE